MAMEHVRHNTMLRNTHLLTYLLTYLLNIIQDNVQVNTESVQCIAITYSEVRVTEISERLSGID